MQVKIETWFTITPLGGVPLENEDGEVLKFPTEHEAQEYLYDSGYGGDYTIETQRVHTIPFGQGQEKNEMKLSEAMNQLAELQKTVGKLMRAKSASAEAETTDAMVVHTTKTVHPKKKAK